MIEPIVSQLIWLRFKTDSKDSPVLDFQPFLILASRLKPRTQSGLKPMRCTWQKHKGKGQKITSSEYAKLSIASAIVQPQK